jgi:hypothetical protein
LGKLADSVASDITELPKLFLVGASAGYPSVPGVIGNGMDVVELLTKQSVWKSGKMLEVSVSILIKGKAAGSN